MMHTTANNRTWDSRGQSDAEAAERKSGQGQKMNRFLSFLFLSNSLLVLLQGPLMQ